MPITYPMRCKFDKEGHGDFANGIALRKHYDTVHANDYEPLGSNRRRVVCVVCGQDVSRGSWNGHNQKMHNGRAAYREAGAKVAVSHSRKHEHVPTPLPAVHEPEKVEPDEAEPWHADHIVLPVIEQLASPGNTVPVAHLAALFTWRDATVAMLQAVQGGRH